VLLVKGLQLADNMWLRSGHDVGFSPEWHDFVGNSATSCGQCCLVGLPIIVDTTKSNTLLATHLALHCWIVDAQKPNMVKSLLLFYAFHNASLEINTQFTVSKVHRNNTVRKLTDIFYYTAAIKLNYYPLIYKYLTVDIALLIGAVVDS